MPSYQICDAINGVLSNHTDVQVWHLEYTRAGHIGLITHTPGSVLWILAFADILKRCLDHGCPPQMISFRRDVGWYRAVVQGVPLPEVWRKVESPKVIRQQLHGELTKWNSALQGEVKRFQPLCQLNDIHSKGMVSILVALVSHEGYEVIHDGVDIYGVHCCVSQYRPRCEPRDQNLGQHVQ
jgi:hypothetical protein